MAELNPIPLDNVGFLDENQKRKVGFLNQPIEPSPADLDRLFSSGQLTDITPSQALDIQRHRRSTRTVGNMLKAAPGAVVQAAKDIGPGIYEGAQLATSFNPVDRVKLALGLLEGGIRGSSDLAKLGSDIYRGRLADPIRVQTGADAGVIARERLLEDRDFKEKRQGMIDGTQPSYIQDAAVLAANAMGLDPAVAQQLSKPPAKFSEAASYVLEPTALAPGFGAARLPLRGRRIADAARKVQQASTPVPNVFGAQNRATAAAVGAVEEAAKPSPGIIQRGVEKSADLSGKVSQKAAQAFDFLEPYKTPLRVAGASVGAVDGGVVGGILGSRAPEAINILGRTSKGALQISKALRSISRADWASRVPVYMQVAKSAEAPAWLKTLATQRVRGVPVASFLESGLRGVTPTLKGAASGGLIGGGLMYADPNKTGEEIGAGSAVGIHLGAGGGLLGHIASHKQRVATAAAYDKLRFIDQAIKDGTDPNVAFKADEALLDTAVVLQALFEGAFPGAKGLTVKLVSPDDPNVKAKDSGQTQAGSFDPATNTAFINVATKDADGRLIHEVLGHGLLETYVSNKPNIIETINGLLSVEQIDAAKLDYAKAVLGPDADDALINSYLKNQNEFDVNWVHTEIFAEAIANSLRGADMLAGTKTIFGRKNRQSFFKDKDTRNAIFSDAMQNLVKEEFEALRDFTPGKDEGKGRGTKLKREMAGNHPGFVVENQGDGTKGNDFVTVTPGGQVVPRPQKQVRKRTRSRRKETKQFFPDKPPVDFRDKDKKVKNRKTPSGKNEKTGTELGEDWHNNSTTFGDQAKQNARIFEEVIRTGDALAAWYQQVIPKVRATIKDTMGGMEVQYKDFIPYAFKVDSRGNILVQNYSLTALYRKINRWLKSDDMDFSLARWNNNKEAFVRDVKQYLNNHATGKPGAEGLGDMATVKRDIINAFLVGKNVTYEAKNPLRSKLTGDDRAGIIRSYRLDRFQTVFESEITGYKSGDYEKWLQNLSPEIQPKEPKFLTPDQIKSQTIQRNERPATSVPGHLTRIEPDTGGRRFADGIRWSARDHKLGAAVEVKSPEFYTDPSTALFLGDDGLAGTAVTKTGDLVSVFKHPDSVSDIRPILADASLLSTTLDAFDVNGFLPNLYSAYGFKPAARVKWNDDYAPPGWPYDLAGRPDVVLMVKDPNNILPEVTADFADIRDQYPLFEDYDAALAVQQELKQKVVDSGLPDFTRYSPEVEESIPVLNVQNEKGFPFADQIIDGQKTIETREHTRLDPLIGKTVKIARTGGKEGGPVIGEVTITGRVDYPTRESFLADADKHLVREGSAFDFTKPKYGYTLENPKRYKEEYKAKVPRGRIYDSSQPGPRFSPQISNKNLAQNRGPWYSIGDGKGQTSQTSRAFQSDKIKAYLQGAKEGAVSPARIASDISGTGKPEPWLKRPTSLNDRDRVIDAEDAALQTWAKESGWYIEPGDLRNLFSEAEDTFTGNEHMVYVLPGGDFVVKRTINNMFGGSPATMETPSGYLQQLVDYNSVVTPQLQKTFLGVSTDALGNGVIVTAQPFISGKKPSDAQLKAVMRRAGFEHISGGEYKHTDTGAIIMDAEPRNVFVQDGQPLPIDVWVKFPEEREFFSPELNDESIIISTRYPSAKKATENPTKNLLVSDLEASYQAPDKAEANFKLMRAYPNFRAQTSDFKLGTEQMVDHMVKNLLWLFDNYPEQYRELAMQWYPGANGIAQRWSQTYGHTVPQISGVIAVLSPQKDWFANVSMAERLLDIYRDHYDFVYSSEMDATRSMIYDPNKPKISPKNKILYTKLEQAMPGQSLKSLIEKGDFYTAASFARTFSQTYHDPSVRILNPRGEVLDFATNLDGVTRSPIRWQGNGPIGKALQILNDGSIANISELAGEKHKVRNFFNNISDPNNPAGFVTMDTHAVAAALLRALGSTDKEPTHNFGSGSANSSVTGLYGTYPIYGEAYTRAAAERGVLPRAMQSVTWEAGKSLFLPEFKRSLGKKSVDDVWKAYKKGELTHEQAIEKVSTLAGGIRPPAWAGSSGGLLGEGTHTSYSQQLLNR